MTLKGVEPRVFDEKYVMLVCTGKFKDKNSDLNWLILLCPSSFEVRAYCFAAVVS